MHRHPRMVSGLMRARRGGRHSTGDQVGQRLDSNLTGSIPSRLLACLRQRVASSAASAIVLMPIRTGDALISGASCRISCSNSRFTPVVHPGHRL